jgi:hypothetical protein
MWVRIDDAFPEHQKVFLAADSLTPSGYERVLSVIVQGICYSNRNLTDGFLPTAVVSRFQGSKPLHVAEVLVDARLLERVEGGYQIHDFNHYQPTAQAVKEKREKDRIRKESAKNPPLIPEESKPNPMRSRARDPGNNPSTTREDQKRMSASADADAVMRLWNETVTAPIPQVRLLTPGRKAKIRARLKTYPDVETWQQAIAWVNGQDWCRASGVGSHPNWTATLDWLIKSDEPIQKALEQADTPQAPARRQPITGKPGGRLALLQAGNAALVGGS